jgi:hypothetical protein
MCSAGIGGIMLLIRWKARRPPPWEAGEQDHRSALQRGSLGHRRRSRAGGAVRGVSLTLEGSNLVRDIGQVAGYVLDSVGVVPGSRRIHLLMIRKGGAFPKSF